MTSQSELFDWYRHNYAALATCNQNISVEGSPERPILCFTFSSANPRINDQNMHQIKKRLHDAKDPVLGRRPKDVSVKLRIVANIANGPAH